MVVFDIYVFANNNFMIKIGRKVTKNQNLNKFK